MPEADIEAAEKILRDATALLQGATSADEERWAMHKWLGGAHLYFSLLEFPTLPGLKLMRALEGIAQGQRSPIFKLPENNARGGREHLHSSERGEALAIVDAFVKAGWPTSKAIGFVAASLEPFLKLDETALTNLRKKASAENQKNPENYANLIAAKRVAFEKISNLVVEGENLRSDGRTDRPPNLEELWEGAAMLRLIQLENVLNIEH